MGGNNGVSFTKCLSTSLDISSYQLQMLGAAFDYIKVAFEDEDVPLYDDEEKE